MHACFEHAGEIIPQALCSRHGLAIGAYSAWFVQLLIWAVWIIAFPISKILDKVLGTEHGVSTPIIEPPATLSMCYAICMMVRLTGNVLQDLCLVVRSVSGCSGSMASMT